MKKIVFVCAFALAFFTSIAQSKSFPFQQSNLPMEARIDDLLNRLTLKEKISLLGYRSASVDRLGIPAYNWWNEGLHGVGRAGNATVFPQAIGMAASFNTPLMKEVATVISTEARAKNNLMVAQNRRLQYTGLSFWSPNINLFRDPRWGRGQETYGEDPCLTSSMGTAFITGLQGSNKNFLKVSACAKHLAVHSGPEATRHIFNALVDEKDLRETYLYSFKKLVDAGVESVMCGYNRLNNEPCCTGTTLAKNILRYEWGFKGQLVTDCWALEDIWLRHKVAPNSTVVAAEAIKTGVNLDCSNLLQDDVMKAIEQGLLTEKEVNEALRTTLRTQFKLGFYDKKNPYSNYGVDSIANTYHRNLARKMAAESMVLLKNDKQLLPLRKKDYGAVMVVGPNAASLDALLGNYHGVSNKTVNFVEGIVDAVGPGTRVEYDMGCDFTDTVHFGGTWAASNADITIAVIGLTPVYEGEEGDAFLSPTGGDRANLKLPASQIAYMKALRKAHNKPIVAVITAGSALDLSDIQPYCDAIIYAWYPGEQGGNALADILFGKTNPAGRLPVSFYKRIEDLPAYSSYEMKDRTYRYFKGEVQYPFGYGLSYTNFSYGWKKAPSNVYHANDSIRFEVSLQNIGSYDGDEVVQVYIQYPDVDRMPVKEMKAFKRVTIKKGATGTASFSIPVTELMKWDLKEGKWKLYPGSYTIQVGRSSGEFLLMKKTEVLINN